MSDHRFEVQATETIYSGAILALRVDEVLMPGGSTARREVVEHDGAVAILAVDDADRIGLIRQYRHPVGVRMLELPAGLLDGSPEESPVAAAGRELIEETGFRADDWALLIDIAASPGMTDEVIRVFVARALTEVGRPVGADDEEADLTVEWIDSATAAQLVLAGEITNATSAAAILAYRHATTVGLELRPADAPWPMRPAAFTARRG